MYNMYGMYGFEQRGYKTIGTPVETKSGMKRTRYEKVFDNGTVNRAVVA